MLDQIQVYLPNLHRELTDLGFHLGRGSFSSALRRAYRRIPPVSIDVGIVEKAEGVLTVRSDFGWSDVGSWNVLDELLPPDSKGNRSSGTRLVPVGASGITVYSNKDVVGLIGVRDLIVVETDDALLIVRKGDEQKTRDLVDLLSSGPRKKIS
jgi:mannose-1-phosphate guanylyltransferase